MSNEHKYEDFERDALFTILSEAERLANVGGWEWDIVKDVWTFSDNWLRIHGCSKRHLATSELLCIAHPDDIKDIEMAFDRAVTGGINYEIEHRIIRQDTGEERYIRAFGRPKLGDDGKAVKLFGAAQDITENKMAEQSLEESERRLSSSIESGEIGLWELNLIDLTAWRSLTHDQIFGYETLLPKWTYEMFLDHVVEEDRPMVEKKFGSALKNREIWDFQCRIKRQDGVIRWIHAKGKPTVDKNQNPIKMYGTIQDITGRKQAEASLRQKHEMLKRTEAIANVGSWEWEIETDTVTWSEELYRIFQLNPDLEAPNWAEHPKLYHPQDFEKLRQAVEIAIADGKPYDIELHALRKDGQTRICTAKGFPETGEDGQIVRFFGLLQDITDRKQAEQNLRDADLKQQEAIRAGNVGLWDWDLEANKVHYSREWKQQIGYQDHEISDDFEEWQSRVHPDDLGPTLAKVKRAIAARRNDHKIEFRFRHRDGSYRWILTQASVIENDAGQPVRMLGSHVDITDRKQIELTLQETNKALKEAQQVAQIGSWWYDPATQMPTWTEEIFHIFGLKPQPEALPYNEHRKVIHPDDWERFDAAVSRAVTDGIGYNLELRSTRPSGEIRYINSRCEAEVYDNGKVKRLIGTVQDITDRKKIENDLKASQKSLSAELEVMKRLHHIGTLFVGERSLNEVLEEILNVAVFITGTDMGSIQLYDPQQASLKMVVHRGFDKTWLDFWDRVHAERCACGPAIKKDGRIIVEDVAQSEIFVGTPALEVQLAAGVRAFQSTPLIGRSGRVLGMISTHFARPHRVHEDTLRQFDLLIRQTTDILEHAQDEAEKKRLESRLIQSQKMESIGNLAGGIAHDFNNILSSIIGFTEIALDETAKGTMIENCLQEVYSAGKRARDLVKQILAFARKSEEKRSPIQPCTIVKEVIQFIRSTIPTTIVIRQNLNSDSWILGNATQVHQVLMNLCTNAAQAMEDSGGILEMSIGDIVVDKVDTSVGLRQGNYVEIKVSDTGAGIPPDLIGSIFEPYFTTKGPGEGTGMGLAMVQGVVESYGGKITVDSQIGKGTTFSIYLPITKRRSTQGDYSAEQLPVGTERILFVDDEAPIAKMSRQILERLGYSVTTRTSSLEALELFQAKPDDFDLVVTDMTMPNLTGDKLVVELMKIRPDIPVILCTGYSKKISDETALGIGIKAFFYKPIVKADLAKIVRKVLDESKCTDQE